MLTFESIRDAASGYVVRLPEVDGPVACPFILNGAKSRPDNKELHRPGAGRISAEQYIEVAKAVSSILMADDNPITSEDVRRVMVDGSLSEDSLNYTGVDCSGFVYGVLRSVIGHKLDQLVTVEESAVRRIKSMYGISYDIDGMSSDRMSLDEFTGIHVDNGGEYDALRNVSVSRIKYSTIPVEINSAEDVMPGDVGIYEPGADGWGHIMVVTGTRGRRIKAWHSGRVDPLSDIGGVSGFSLPISRLAESTQGHRGALSVQRFPGLSGIVDIPALKVA